MRSVVEGQDRRRDATLLVDRWGALRSKAKKLEAEIQPLKEEFDRRGLTAVAGESWGVARSESTFASLDVKAIRAEMGPEWCAKREKPQTRVFVTPKLPTPSP